jgi:hypothetical protein
MEEEQDTPRAQGFFTPAFYATAAAHLEQSSPKFPGSVPFSMNAVRASPEGSRWYPSISQATIENGTRLVRTVWRGDWRGNPAPVSFTENGTDPGNFGEVCDVVPRRLFSGGYQF